MFVFGIYALFAQLHSLQLCALTNNANLLKNYGLASVMTNLFVNYRALVIRANEMS